MDAASVGGGLDVIGRLTQVVNEIYDQMVQSDLVENAPSVLDDTARSRFVDQILPVMCDIVFRISFTGNRGSRSASAENLDASLTTQATYQFEAVLARLSEVRALSVAVEDLGGEDTRTSIGKRWNITGSRVGKLIDEEFLDQPIGEGLAGDASGAEFDLLRLNPDELLTVSWAVLMLMNRDIDASDITDPRMKHARVLYRGLLTGNGNSTLPGHAEFEEVLKARLGSVSSSARSVIMLVEICASEPWGSIKRPLDPMVREESLNWIVDAMGGGVHRKDVRAVDRALKEIYDPKSSKIRRWAVPLGVAALAVVATGGVAVAAAPAIGTAIGGVMGLSGAAATSAGLAWLGGGALASGGMGMAGGTALLAGAGALLGIPVGATAARRIPRSVIKAEAAMLYATASTFKSKAADSNEMRDAYDLCVRGIRQSLEEVGDEAAGGLRTRTAKSSELKEILKRLGEHELA